MLIRQTLVVFGSVSPSAASTQVVPNGGKRKYGSGGGDQQNACWYLMGRHP